MLLFVKNVGADDDPEPERHPCSDFFEICCKERRNWYDFGHARVSSSRPDRCGVRNINGVAFNLIERDNESQYGEFVMGSDVHI